MGPHGSTSVMLPIRKIRLSEEQISRPIPTLSDRQFVVAKSNLSSVEQRTQRELFWYRETLLENVHASWKEVRASPNTLHRDSDMVNRAEVIDTETYHSDNRG